MTQTITLPLWLFTLILLFAAVTFASHFLFPSVRWFFRRRMERAVAQINKRLQRPIQPFKLLRRYDLIQRLCYDPEVTQAIVDYAREHGVREDVAFERARRYAKEIVPSFSAFAYFGWGVRGAKFLSNALYRVRLGHPEAAASSRIDPDATVIYVMNHRSNMDYVLVTHLAAERTTLSYAVGEWAQVWPLSSLIRSMGAYFIRRRSRDALYRKVLRRYVQMATRGGVTQAIFPEGGLSLDGAIQPPRLGLLSYILEDIDLAERDVVFVPVALNYDRVLEDTVLIRKRKSGSDRFGASISHVSLAVLKQLWLRLTGRFHRFGHASVNFGQPVSLRLHPEIAEDSQALGAFLMEQIASLVPVLPVPVIAHILLSREVPQSRAQIEVTFGNHLKMLGEDQVYLPRNNRDYAVETGLRALVERRVVIEEHGLYRLDPTRRDIAEFYANSIRHLLGPVATP